MRLLVSVIKQYNLILVKRWWCWEGSLKELPAAPQVQAIAAPPEDEDEEGVMQVGKIAHKYLSDYAAKQTVDKTFGIYKNLLDKLYYIGNTETTIIIIIIVIVVVVVVVVIIIIIIIIIINGKNLTA